MPFIRSGALWPYERDRVASMLNGTAGRGVAMAIANDLPLTCLDAGGGPPRQLSPAEISAVAKALAHPARLQIIEAFRTRCPRSVGEIAAELPLAQSTVSMHLRVLRDANLLHTQKAGPTWHCLNRAVLDGFAVRVRELGVR